MIIDHIPFTLRPCTLKHDAFIIIKCNFNFIIVNGNFILLLLIKCEDARFVLKTSNPRFKFTVL